MFGRLIVWFVQCLFEDYFSFGMDTQIIESILSTWDATVNNQLSSFQGSDEEKHVSALRSIYLVESFDFARGI